MIVHYNDQRTTEAYILYSQNECIRDAILVGTRLNPWATLFEAKVSSLLEVSRFTMLFQSCIPRPYSRSTLWVLLARMAFQLSSDLPASVRTVLLWSSAYSWRPFGSGAAWPSDFGPGCQRYKPKCGRLGGILARIDNPAAQPQPQKDQRRPR